MLRGRSGWGGFHYQHPEHLATVGIFLDFGMTADVCLNLTGCQLAQWMRLVAERIGESLWALDVGM